ncbi:MAG: response regulator transcription factor [Alphaproteobacteria bacterium]|nr:response regulator transcription factor [Alphaproteobacteria bacterium]MBU1515692.1 response regulator transcription factor [Alphaproteobacteria bacterium]MBU2096975.1 response regulator transcription factor [Alphaproteobacteria bacterium]MBU2149491.1 response regulator transcription factor [Alphaproteobacteria bacterium]MBU2308877.1 response regulator transcription factor [Alphaproteobacteria bacterium]
MSFPDTPARTRHLLVVDDDDRIRDLLKEYLTRAGFRVTAASGGAPARRLLATLDFDLAVFDVMMPGEDGFSLTRWLREQRGAPGRTPVLMLTAKTEAGDRIEGLKTGADDYLGKPFEPEELLLRIEAILRRASDRQPMGGALSLGRCTFDADRGELSSGGEAIRLTEAEVALLRQLARTPHEAVDRLELAHGSVDPSGRAVDVQVTRLRRKIEDDPKAPRYLQTVRGVGYRLAPD